MLKGCINPRKFYFQNNLRGGNFPNSECQRPYENRRRQDNNPLRGRLVQNKILGRCAKELLDR